MEKLLEQVEKEAIKAIARAMRNTSFYSLNHPTVRTNIEEISAAINHLLEDKREFVLKIVDGEIIADDRPLFDLGTGTANLVGACLRRGIESITFLAGLHTEEAAAFISVLVSDPKDLERQGGPASALALAGVRHIAMEKLHLSKGAAMEVEEGFAGQVAGEVYASALDVLRETTRQARMGVVPELDPTYQAVSSLIDSIILEQASALGLVAVKGRDEYTFTHVLHICILCLELGQSMGLSKEQLQQLGVCALLHDIGKIYIPLPILRKPTALNAEEFSIVERHPLYGALLLCRQEKAPSSAPLVAFEHHLHYDLSGYPRLSKARALNFYSLLVGPADVYDALTTDRPYRSALPPEQALEIMHAEASQFEPRILDRFTAMLGKYPPGSLVRLGNGDMAVVTKPNPQQISRPLVRIVEWREGQPRLAEKETDLSRRNGSGEAYEYSIDAILDPVAEKIDVCALTGGNPFCAE